MQRPFVLALSLAMAIPSGFASAAPTVKIGVDLPLSGIDGADAIPSRNGVVLAIEEANRRGFPGGVRVELDDLDDSVQGKHDPAQGAVNMRSFASDPDVLAVVGPMNSNVAEAEIPISNAAGLAQITMAASSIELTRGPLARRLRSSHPELPSFFRTCASDDRQGGAVARFARSRGLRRAFVIDDNESYGRGLADVFASVFPTLGGTILGREHLTAFALDYKSLLTKIHASAPDAIFFGGVVSTGGGILRRQMGDVGLAKVAYFGGDGLSSPQYVPLAGASAEDTFFSIGSPNVTHLPQARAFRAAYRARFGAEPGDYSAGAYAAALVALEAIRATESARGPGGNARGAVLAAVRRTTGLATPVGSISFDPDGDLREPIVSLYRIHDGRVEFVTENREPGR